MRARIPAVLFMLALAACGDGPTDPPAAGGSALVIAPGALLFAEPGATQQLRAFAVDADGDSTEVAASFSSSDPAVVSVTAGGLATGGSSLGSAQIVAQSGDLVSAPALALRATPAAGALLVADSQVVGNIDPLSSRGEYGPGWRYQVHLRNAQPSTGQIVLATGSAPVAGRVVAVTAEGAGVLATVELLDIGDLFTELELDETIPLSNVAPVVPSSFRRSSPRPAGALHLGAADVEFEIGSFECAAKGEFGQEGFTLDAGDLSLVHSLSLEVALSASDGLRRMVVVGNVQASQSFKPRITLTVSGEIECHAILFTIPLPITGPLSFFIGGQIPLGAGFTLAGELSFPNVGADIALAVQGQLATGIDCTGGCHPIFELSTSGAGSTFKPALPAQFGTAGRLKLDASGFARVEFAVGSALLQEFQYEILAVKLGLTQSFDLATREGQASDPAYASSFSIKPLIYGGTESEADSLGIWGIELPALEFEPDLEALDKSPTGTLSVAPAVVAAGTDAAVGELATFTITISDPSYLGAYAVEGVELRWQKTNGTVVTLDPGRPGCSDLAAAADQLTFTCQTDFLAEHAGAQTFYAFLKTRIFGIPIPVPLEVAPNGSATLTVSSPDAGGSRIRVLELTGGGLSSASAGPGDGCTDIGDVPPTGSPASTGAFSLTCSDGFGPVSVNTSGAANYAIVPRTEAATSITIAGNAAASATFSSSTEPLGGGVTSSNAIYQIAFEISEESEVSLTGEIRAATTGSGSATSEVYVSLVRENGGIVYEGSVRVTENDPPSAPIPIAATLLLAGQYRLLAQAEARASVNNPEQSQASSSAVTITLTVSP